ncbi:uncharacterized protein LOC132194805 [Neocloeon triangulifer]|uniref:uncharacterized protein LOC132194805 n=1 Tax=Neocloeon triangulifer TaxID=2078957 RepID=UPI00286F9B06|nr:uncharacterized protein LOC132194805 [Neocloeon triangulifer]
MQISTKMFCVVAATVTFTMLLLHRCSIDRFEFAGSKYSSALFEEIKFEETHTKGNATTESTTVADDGNYNGLADNDKRLLKYAKSILVPPHSRSEPYNLKNASIVDYSQESTSIFIHSLLKNKTNGFFVECGALDGEWLSNSLMLEKNFNWTGLLIEGGAKNVQEMLKKNRKAWVAPTCLSTSPKSMAVTFNDNIWAGHILQNPNESKAGGYVNITCIPFNTFVDVLELKHIDYFSLDVEGNELEILRTIDFKKFTIDVMVVEHLNVGNKYDGILQIMKENGFTLVSKTRLDLTFIHNGTINKTI